MMHIKYTLGASDLHGIGVFADEDLHKGQLIYTASPMLDVNISQAEFESLPDKEKAEVAWWGYKVPNKDIWHVDFDVSKFINHSDEGSVTQDRNHEGAYVVAARDIRAGEELTQNYLEFESTEDVRKRGIK